MQPGSDKVKKAKRNVREMHESTTGKGTEGFGEGKSVADPWKFMDTGEVKYGPDEFREGKK